MPTAQQPIADNQLDMFAQPTHFENTVENQQIYDDNIAHFSNQCRIVYEALLRGERLTTGEALKKYDIGDLRARIRDLIAHGIPVQKELLKSRFKEYYLNLNVA